MERSPSTLLHGSRVGARSRIGEEVRPFPEPLDAAVPFKANAACRHHIPKQRHRVTNWAEYDAALRQRGSLTVLCGRPEVLSAFAPKCPGNTRYCDFSY
jgi:hypothetical protein